jgi:succinate dehydrogenase assembly factor 2
MGTAGVGVVGVLSDREQSLYQIARPRSEQISIRHEQMPDLSSIPKASLTSATNALDVRRKRLIYRAKQRGWLEVNLLLGTYASQNVMSFDAKELDEFEAFVNMETIDIYNIITLRVLELPSDFITADGTGMVERIQAWAKSNPLGKADPEAYKKVKAEANLI